MTFCVFALLVLHSPSPICHAFYETFLHLHIALVAMSFACPWVNAKGHAAQRFLLGSTVLWAMERVARLVTILHRNGGRVATTAVVESLPGDLLRLALLLAGSVGITHLLLYLQRLVRGRAEGTVAARRITLVWAVQSLGYVESVEDWLGRVIRMAMGREELLRGLIYVTRAGDPDEIGRFGFGSTQVFRGRPSVEKVLAEELGHQVGAMGVLCCANGALSDDVRRVCRVIFSRSALLGDHGRKGSG